MRKVLIIVGDFVDCLEVFTPWFALKAMGIQVDIVTPGKKPGDKVCSAVHDSTSHFQTYVEKLGYDITINADFDLLEIQGYDGLWIPGGRAPEYLRQNPQVLSIVKHFFDSNKPVACVCHGPLLLISAGVLQGRRITSYSGIADDCIFAGAKYVKTESPEDCVFDQNLVTGQSQPSCPAMIAKFSEMLGCKTIVP